MDRHPVTKEDITSVVEMIKETIDPEKKQFYPKYFGGNKC